MTFSIPKNTEGHKQYRQSLGNQVNSIEQEARMVLPGIQALFGFQLIAVFNQGFQADLLPIEQIVHLAALLLSAISAALVIAPAAYHRQANHQISVHFVQLSSRFLAWALVPLAIGICLDIYVVTRIIVHTARISAGIAGIVFLFYSWIWFIYPRLRAKRIKKLPVHDLDS